MGDLTGLAAVVMLFRNPAHGDHHLWVLSGFEIAD